MIFERADRNTMPEQVQENKNNIQALKELIEEIDIGIIKGKKIWENEDPTSAFAETVVSLADMEFSKYEIIFAEATNSSRTISIPFLKDHETQAQMLNTQHYYERGVSFDALNNEIVLADATDNNIVSATYSVDNSKLIPLVIIGYYEEIE